MAEERRGLQWHVRVFPELMCEKSMGGSEHSRHCSQVTGVPHLPQLVLDACFSVNVPAEAARAALSVFDATRLAVLVCEREAAARAEGDADREGSGVPSMQQLLALARASLAQPGADGTGMALLEGVLTLQPANYLAAALQLALACETQTERSDVLRML